MCNWQLLTWGDIAELKYGKALKDYQDKNGGYKVYGTNGPIGFHEEYIYDKPSIIVGRKGAYRGIHYSDKPFFVIDTAFFVVPKVSNIDIRFGYYQLLTIDLNSYDSGSAIPSTTKEDFYSIPLLLPPLEEQIKISEFLHKLDHKIFLLRRQNEILEQMAQAIFKHWFVDFEFPMSDEYAASIGKPELEGKPYKSSGGKMVEADWQYGDIPTKWTIDSIEGILSVIETGSRPKGGVSKYDEGIPSIGAESITGIGKFEFSKTKYVPYDYYNSMAKGKIRNRDILVYKDGGAPGTFIPHISLFGEGFPYEDMVINEHVFRLVTKTKHLQNFLFLWMNTYYMDREMRIKGTGAAIPGLNSTQLKSLSIIKPPSDLIIYFDGIVEPMIKKILLNSKQMKLLSDLRDTLLPKLMSGEIKV